MNPKVIDFIGIAASRCGSSWLSECLRQHPDIDFPKRTSPANQVLNWMFLRGEKELDFFSVGEHCEKGVEYYSNADKGLEWYLDRFPKAAPGRIRGEFTPEYHCYSGAATAIKLTLPDIKLIAVLRNPPEAAYSLHRFLTHLKGTESDSFDQAVVRGQYLPRFSYARTLRPFFEAFPRDRIHVVLYDDIKRDPARVVRETFAFLGVREDFVPTSVHERINEVSKARSGGARDAIMTVFGWIRRLGLGRLVDLVNRNGVLRQAYFFLNTVKESRPPMTEKTRAAIRAYYREDIAELERLLGRDLSTWR